MIRARVTRPVRMVGARMYIDVEIDGRTHTVKVPFKYGRVTCKVLGLTPVQSLIIGDIVQVSLETKIWQGKDYKVLDTICLHHRDTSPKTTPS
jgi:hypothetical protein